MNTLRTHYLNNTPGTVKVKSKSGAVKEVKSKAGVASDFGDPFIKIKYPTTGWRKF